MQNFPLSPDFCVRQTETVFAKVGAWSLLFAKFFPGLSTISVAMAGITEMSLPVFLVLDGIGALLFVGLPVGLGWIFQDAITDILVALRNAGKSLALPCCLCQLWAFGALLQDGGDGRRSSVSFTWTA